MQEVFGMSFGSQEVLQASSVREASEGVGGVGGARRVWTAVYGLGEVGMYLIGRGCGKQMTRELDWTVEGVLF